MRLQALDGWRGITAIIVVVFHTAITFQLHGYGGFFSNEAWRHFSPILEFFFVCSGFVIGMIYGDRLSDRLGAGKFMFLRIARLWPMHVVVLALMVGLETFRAGLWSADLLNTGLPPFTGPTDWRALPLNALMIQAWQSMDVLTWNYPSWTISAEMIAYSLLVLICLTLPQRWRIGASVLVVLVAGAVFYAETGGLTEIKASVFRCLTGFFLGYLLQMVWKRWPIRSRLVGTVLEVVSVIGTIAVLTLHVKGVWYLSSLLVFALLIYSFSCEKGLLSPLFAARPLLWIGERAFSIYMLHAVVIEGAVLAIRGLHKLAGVPLEITDAFGRLGGVTTALQADLFVLGVTALCVLLAIPLYTWVEAPLRSASAGYAAKRFRKPQVEQWQRAA